MPYRNISKLIKFSPEEWDEVAERAAVAKKPAGRFVREMAIQGAMTFYDVKEVNYLRMSFNRIGTEINQIAKVANSTKSIYQKDIEDLRARFAELEDILENYLAPLDCGGVMKGK